jgi:flagellar hook-length control protein FliK
MPVPLDALAVQIARRFDEGSSQFDISLHPAELGKVDVSLNVSQDGRVHAVLRAERAETLDLLRQDARSLETQLRQAGLDVGANSLSFQLSQGGNQRQQASAADFAKTFSQDDGSASADIVKTAYVAVRKRDGLDIHV